MYEHIRAYLIALWPGEMEAVTSHGVEGHWQVNGRADHIGFNNDQDILDIDDLKYGYSIVEPENNWTLISHAVAWSKTHNHLPTQTRIRIHQPRPYHPLGSLREWIVSDMELVILANRIDATLSNPEEILRTGEHCNKCPKNGHCPAFRKAGMNAIDTLEHAFTDQFSDEQLADEYRLIEHASKVIKYRLDALKDMATDRVRNGKVLPGLALERTYSNTVFRKYITPKIAQVITGRDLTKRKMMTPNEAKAYGVPELILQSITDRVETGVKLVKFDPSKKMEKWSK